MAVGHGDARESREWRTAPGEALVQAETNLDATHGEKLGGLTWEAAVGVAKSAGGQSLAEQAFLSTFDFGPSVWKVREAGMGRRMVADFMAFCRGPAELGPTGEGKIFAALPLAGEADAVGDHIEAAP
jgi:hypothetical protein